MLMRWDGGAGAEDSSVVGQASNSTTPRPLLIRRHCSGQLCAVWTQLRHHQRAPARRDLREALGQRLVIAAAWRRWMEATGFMVWVQWDGCRGMPPGWLLDQAANSLFTR